MAGVFVYDDACGFCTRFATFVAHRADGRLVLRPGAPSDSALLIDEGGAVVLRRAAAIGGALSAVGGPVGLAGRVVGARFLRPIADRAYDLVARNRGRLGCGTSCSI